MEKRYDFNARLRPPGGELSAEVATGDLAEQSQMEKRNDFNARER
jgi:hypothetical protein